MIHIDIPGHDALHIKTLLMDFNGTLALDGYLLDGVSGRLENLSRILDLVVLTADTFGLVAKSCSGLPLKIQKTRKGHEALQKQAVLEEFGVDCTAAIGNGANDVMMLEKACLGIAVLGPEGLCPRAIAAADICVPDICCGLDMLLFPKRIVATLRQ